MIGGAGTNSTWRGGFHPASDDRIRNLPVQRKKPRDKTEARSLEIHRTSAIFINGRRYTDDLDLPSLKDGNDEELGR